MYRISLVAIPLLLSLLAACGDGQVEPRATHSPPSLNGSTVVPVTPVAKPTSVPESAAKVVETTELGRIERRANAPPEGIDTRELTDAACEDDVLVLETSDETIYAALPCDRFQEDQVEDVVLDQEVAIVLEVTDVRFRVLIETLEGALAEFTVAGIWLE